MLFTPHAHIWEVFRMDTWKEQKQIVLLSEASHTLMPTPKRGERSADPNLVPIMQRIKVFIWNRPFWNFWNLTILPSGNPDHANASRLWSCRLDAILHTTHRLSYLHPAPPTSLKKLRQEWRVFRLYDGHRWPQDVIGAFWPFCNVGSFACLSNYQNRLVSKYPVVAIVAHAESAIPIHPWSSLIVVFTRQMSWLALLLALWLCSTGSAEEAECRRRFDRFATKPGNIGNEPDFLSFQDFTRLMEHYEASATSNLVTFFYAIDRNRDDKLDFQEFFLGSTAADPQTVHILNSFTGKERAAFTFDFYDANRSGFLELEEFQKVCRDCAIVSLDDAQLRRHTFDKAMELGLMQERLVSHRVALNVQHLSIFLEKASWFASDLSRAQHFIAQARANHGWGAVVHASQPESILWVHLECRCGWISERYALSNLSMWHHATHCHAMLRHQERLRGISRLFRFGKSLIKPPRHLRRLDARTRCAFLFIWVEQ